LDALADIAHGRSVLGLNGDEAVRDRSVKLLPLFVRTYSFQLTEPSLLSAPNTSLGNGTTTSSTLRDNCFTSMCWGGCAPCAQSADAVVATAHTFRNLDTAIIASFDC
jgi:hypothetical protein